MAADLIALVNTFTTVITYAPLRTEVAFSALVPSMAGHVYEIPARAAIDPTEEALKAAAFANEEPTCVLIPGRRFDASGTRLGQGGGWYDRFLARVPSEWLRIGFCFDDQFSSTPLPRESWDQVMDYVAVVARDSGTLTLHATNARS